MKKTKLSSFLYKNAVEALNIQKQYCLRGGCGGEEGGYPPAKLRDDETHGDDGCNNGGEEGFIPPPGK